MILEVYGLKSFQIVDAPKWLSDNDCSFDIEAKSATPATADQLKLMAQTLLAERFQLKVHRDTREMPVYLLTVGKNGRKIQAPLNDGRPLTHGAIERVSPGVIRGDNVTMATLIRNLSKYVDRPIPDKTDIAEPFDFHLEWAPDNAAAKPMKTEQPPDDSRPSIFAPIQEQLGLKLTAQKAQVEVLANRSRRETVGELRRGEIAPSRPRLCQRAGGMLSFKRSEAP
jgi:uncharacterized protein (TIGR03435 family)